MKLGEVYMGGTCTVFANTLKTYNYFKIKKKLIVSKHPARTFYFTVEFD